MNRIITLLTLIVALSACTTHYEENTAIRVDAPERLYVTFEEPDTRTQIDNNRCISWSAGDEISYFPGIDANVKYVYNGATGSRDGEFNLVAGGSTSGSVIEGKYAIYPYDSNTSISLDGTISYTLPTTQQYSVNTFGLGTNVMVASTHDKNSDNLYFKNVCGYLKLQVYGDSSTIKSVTIEGNDGEPIAGRSWIKASNDTDPSIEILDDEATCLMLDCQSGVKLGTNKEQATIFWFVIPETHFENGIKVTIIDLDGDIYTKSTTKSVEIKRNTIQPMSPFKVDLKDGDNTPEEYPLISTNPAFITDGNEDIVVTLNAAGTALSGYTGSVYVHTGLITSRSTSITNWRYTKADWSENTDACRMTNIGGDVWQFTIKGGVRTFYSVPTSGEIIKKVAMVFRSSDCKKEVKSGDKDFLFDVVTNELQVKFTSPDPISLHSINEQITVQVDQLGATSVTLYHNGEIVKTSSASSIFYTYTPTRGEDAEFVAIATNGSNSVEATLNFSVIGKTEIASRPSGVKDGVNIDGDKVTFVLFAPGKSSVFVLGDWNKYTKTYEGMMKRDGDYFWTTIDGFEKDVEYGYQYLVDENIKIGDPYSELILDPWNDQWISSSIFPNLKKYPSNYTSEIVSVFKLNEPEYNWQATLFKRPAYNMLAIYELHIRDFTTSRSIDAVKDKLDYLDALGINAIELMPIQEFDGNDSWGYNPSYYFAPDKAYGTKRAFQQFIDECHKRGIAVIVDVVFNHATGLCPYAKMWWDSANNRTASNNPFFNVYAPHNFSVYHDFNHTYHKTRSYFKDVLCHWLTEYKVDGFRFDLSKGLVQNPSNYDAYEYSTERVDILTDYANTIRDVAPDAYIIFEHFCDWWEEENLYNTVGGLCWNNNQLEGYLETGMGWSGKSDFSDFKSRRINNIETHDEERVAYKMNTYGQDYIKNSWFSQRASKQLQGLYALHFLTPYPKMMWQFGELGYDVSIMANENGIIGNGDEYRTNRKPIRWNYYDDVNRRSLYDAISKMITFRTSRSDIYDVVDVPVHRWKVGDDSFGGKTLVMDKVIVVANFGNSHVSFDIDVPFVGVWTNLMTGASVSLGSKYTVSLNGGDYIILVR